MPSDLTLYLVTAGVSLAFGLGIGILLGITVLSDPFDF